ncbi:MAG TPA: cupin domain-containing protein [Solimonas sp.]|nr:cupin domain-containing protein [Solimonas sp.]
MRRIFAAGLVLVAVAAGAANLPEGAVQLPVERQFWESGPASMPAGTQKLVLEGDPAKAGPFTMRLRLKPGTHIAPHTHPRPERVTVISGAVAVGFGDKFLDTQMQVFRAGSYYVNPPGVAHYVGIVEDSVVQITAEGPWEVHYLK